MKIRQFLSVRVKLSGRENIIIRGEILSMTLSKCKEYRGSSEDKKCLFSKKEGKDTNGSHKNRGTSVEK